MAVLPDAVMLKFKKEKYADHPTFTVTRNNEIRFRYQTCRPHDGPPSSSTEQIGKQPQSNVSDSSLNNRSLLKHVFCSGAGYLKLCPASSGVWWEKETERVNKRPARGLTECVLSQPGYGHFVNGHYAILPPPSISPPDWKDTISGRLATPPVYVDLRVNETDESQQRSLAKTEAVCFLKHVT